MSISVACQSCGLKVKAPDKAAGKTAKCPKCGTPIAVPGRAGNPGKPPAQKRNPPAEQDAEDLAAALLSEGTEPAPPPRSAFLPDAEDESIAPNLPLPQSRQPVNERPAEKKCPACGITVQAASAFCPGCGIDLRTGPKPQPKAGKARAGIIWAATGLVVVILLAGSFFAYRSMTAKRATNEGGPVAEQKQGEKATPLERFRSLGELVKSRLEGYPGESVQSLGENSVLQNATLNFRYDTGVPVSYDVRKTNSLVTPYAGTIKFGLIQRIQGLTKQLGQIQPAGIKLTYFQKQDCTAQYAYQDEMWVLKELRLTTTSFSFEPTENWLVNSLWAGTYEKKEMIGATVNFDAARLAAVPLLARVL
jgi:hypothetical protein